MEYEQMLKQAIKNMPAVVEVRARFEIPAVRGHLEGNKTVIGNFVQIANVLRRQPEHLLKYVLRELASPGDIREGRAVMGTKLPAQRINEKIRQYANEFVLCPKCGKPDTVLLKEGEFTTLKCSACGTRTNVKSRI